MGSLEDSKADVLEGIDLLLAGWLAFLLVPGWLDALLGCWLGGSLDKDDIC